MLLRLLSPHGALSLQGPWEGHGLLYGGHRQPRGCRALHAAPGLEGPVCLRLQSLSKRRDNLLSLMKKFEDPLS